MLIELFARKEKSTDSLVFEIFKNKHDVVVYRDSECQNPIARWNWELCWV